MVELSVVCSTLGRDQDLSRLLDSLERQNLKSIEMIIVDQNSDERVTRVLSSGRWSFPIEHVRTPDERGLNRGRNKGLWRAKGKHVVFADDDCWYPESLFQRVKEHFEVTGADIVCGRAADETGRSINGRFETSPGPINRHNVWTTSIEWMLFFRRDVLEVLHGFDESVGVGASTPWQSAEGQEILLRALQAGYAATFDPSLTGRHPELNIADPDKAMRLKARGYARGMGYVLGRHGYGAGSLVTWLGRPAIGAALYALKGKPRRALYYLQVVAGRWEGWHGALRARETNASLLRQPVLSASPAWPVKEQTHRERAKS